MPGTSNQVLSGHCYTFLESALAQTPYNYFEIGVFNGVGTAHLARIHTNKTIFAVDPFIEDGHTKGASHVSDGEKMVSQRQNFDANTAGLENITLFETTSEEFAGILNNDMIDTMQIGWVLIDGDHHYDPVTVDYELAIKLIGPRAGGIVFDDLDVEGVGRAFEDFKIKYADRIVDIASNIFGGQASAVIIKAL